MNKCIYNRTVLVTIAKECARMTLTSGRRSQQWKGSIIY